MTRIVTETVLGFDVGMRRIGVAVGNDLLRQARAAAIVELKQEDDPENDGFAAIERLVREWQPERLVVGIPLPVDSSDAQPARPSPSLARCERFATRLVARFHLPVERVDERYSSRDADRLHRDRRQAGLARRAKALDDVAAEVILQRYFDSLPAA